MLISFTLLISLAAIPALAIKGACGQGPYSDVLLLSTYKPAHDFCSRHFPIATAAPTQVKRGEPTVTTAPVLPPNNGSNPIGTAYSSLSSEYAPQISYLGGKYGPGMISIASAWGVSADAFESQYGPSFSSLKSAAAPAMTSLVAQLRPEILMFAMQHGDNIQQGAKVFSSINSQYGPTMSAMFETAQAVASTACSCLQAGGYSAAPSSPETTNAASNTAAPYLSSKTATSAPSSAAPLSSIVPTRKPNNAPPRL